MTKISKQTKLKAIYDYLNGIGSINKICQKYHIDNTAFRVLLAAYRTHGTDALFNPPTVTPEFRVQVVSWAIRNNASITEVAAHFGYTGIAQIVHWKQIYSQLGPNGLLSIQKGRPTKMTRKPKKQLNESDNRLAKLEDENLRLKIENEALKLLASIQQRDNKSQKSSTDSRHNSD